MKSMKLREQAGAGQGLPMSQSESLHTPRVWLLALFWPAGRQLAWLRGGLQWRAEVDFSRRGFNAVGSCREL